jgi:branched-chain amino acid transport system ATP-binding protein
MLEIRNVDFYYDEVQILTGVSLTVSDGEFAAIFGPNGHGKSTLLKVVCGLLRSASGKVYYDGEDITRKPIQEIVNQGLVYIAEDRHLFPEMSVMDNLKMGAFVPHARARESDNLEYVFHLFPKLKTLNKQRASSLSGGEARMLAIGRGLMSNPRFLCIDEPSFGLAPNLRADVFRAIDEVRTKGASVLLVEQSTTLASDYADRLYVLEDGEIVYDGTKEEAWSNDHIKSIFLGI